MKEQKQLQKIYSNLKSSDITNSKRSSFKASVDKFASFVWDGIAGFDLFGAFIINNKGSLKFYNGPTYSNEYTKTQFDSNTGTLMGVNFSTQKIKFTIGVYWITEEMYRYMINWLSPYTVSKLGFDFEPKFAYTAKLASVSNGTRYFLGYDDDGQEAYYTELDLEFDVQGDGYPIARVPNEYKYDSFNEFYRWDYKHSIYSDLSTPLEFIIPLERDIDDTNANNIVEKVFIKAIYGPDIEGFKWNQPDTYNDQIEVITLLSLELKNLDYNDMASIFTAGDGVPLSFEERQIQEKAQALNNPLPENIEKRAYSENGAHLTPTSNDNFYLSFNTETGLVFLVYGDSYKLLSTLNTLPSGKKFVKSLNTRKFKIPGLFEMPNFDNNKLKFGISRTRSYNTIDQPDQRTNNIYTMNNVIIENYSKTNAI